jgi:hypothetical protein
VGTSPKYLVECLVLMNTIARVTMIHTKTLKPLRSLDNFHGRHSLPMPRQKWVDSCLPSFANC